MRRAAAVFVVALTAAACGSGDHAALTRAPGTTTTSTSSTTTTSTALAPTTTRAKAPASPATTTRRTTTTRSTIPGPVLIRYRIERHTNDEPTASFAADVEATLTDPRGWQRAGFIFQRADDGQYTILLGEGPEVRERCRPYDTYGKYSCQIGPLVAITADRWRFATPEWTGDLVAYRQMVVGHEVGHLLGLHHRRCPGRGQPAPLLAQQSTELNGCRPNPWPLPEEVARAGRHDLALAPGYEPGNPTDPP